MRIPFFSALKYINIDITKSKKNSCNTRIMYKSDGVIVKISTCKMTRMEVIDEEY